MYWVQLTSQQVGKFVIGEPEPENEMMIPEEMVPQGRRFPSLVRGQGVRGHRYHVFNEPKYWQWEIDRSRIWSFMATARKLSWAFFQKGVGHLFCDW